MARCAVISALLLPTWALHRDLNSLRGLAGQPSPQTASEAHGSPRRVHHVSKQAWAATSHHTRTHASQAEDLLRAAVEASPTDAKSVKLGSSAGSADLHCGEMLAAESLEQCSGESMSKYKELSKWISRNPGAMASVARQAILVGDGGPKNLTNCVVDTESLVNAESSADTGGSSEETSTALARKPHHRLSHGAGHGVDDATAFNKFRLIVDSQYNNIPRCCSPMETPGLHTVDGGFLPWTEQVLAALPWHHARILDLTAGKISLLSADDGEAAADDDNTFRYTMIWPTDGTCTRRSPCPLLMQIPGEGDMVPGVGDPWMLVQASCEQCRTELKSAIVSLEMPIDLFFPNRSSNEVILSRLGPLTRALLAEYPVLDQDRVYLIAQSRGCDSAFRAMMMFPDLYKFTVLSGLWNVSQESRDLVAQKGGADGTKFNTATKAIQFHLGDQDTSFSAGDFYDSLSEVLGIFRTTQIDFRIYPESKHSVWFAAWNSLHEVIWTGNQGLNTQDDITHIPYTCAAPALIGSALLFRILLTLTCIALFWGGAGKLWTDYKVGKALASLVSNGKTPAAEPLVAAAVPAVGGPPNSTGFGTNAAAAPPILPAPQEPPAQRINRERLSTFTNLLDLFSPGSNTVAIGAVSGSKQKLTHARLCTSMQESDLAPFGIEAKSAVATMVPAGDLSAGMLVALFARYAVAPLNADLKKDELLIAVELLGVKAVITTSAVAERIGTLPDHLKHLVIVPNDDVAGIFSFRFVNGDPPAHVEKRSPLNGPDDYVLLLQTSGTTSKPKTVPVTLRRLMLGAMVYGEAQGITSADHCLNVMPFYHIGGILTSLFAVLLNGGSVYCAAGMREDAILGWLRDFSITYYSSVPTTHQLVMTVYETADSAAKVGARLRAIATGAAHLPHPLAVRLRDTTGAKVIPTYGMSECMPISCSASDYNLERPESVGRPVDEMLLHSSDGEPVPQGEQGEVCVKGLLCMPHYLGDGVASYYGDKWFRTGDLGVVDEAGVLYLVGRCKEVINRGGELVSPFEIESIAVTFPGIAKCMAFGAFHEELGEAPAIAVVPTGERFGVQELQKFLLEKLTHAKVPEAIVYCADIPKGRTGKVERIGFAKRIQLEKLSAGMPVSQKVFEAEPADHSNPAGQWVSKRIEIEGAEVDDAADTVDSLGFARKNQTADDVQASRTQEALYGICIAKLMINHWLPHGSLATSLPAQPTWVMAFLGGVQDCRTLLVLIFPLLGFFDGREALKGDNPLRRGPMVLGIYMLMSWPMMLPSLGAGFATFHRWPIYVWLSCMAMSFLFKAMEVRPLVQVLAPLVIAPFFGHTLDNLHERLGGQEITEGPPFQDPSLMLLENRFYYSVGAKIYFAACYFFAYHILARDDVTKHMMKLARSAWWIRIAAFIGFITVTALWQTVCEPFDATAPEELADWPGFFKIQYPLMVMTDWLCMALVVIAVGEGNALLRLMGAYILGTMIVHMYLQLPFGDILEEAAFIGGPSMLLAVFVFVPVLYTLSVGRIFQTLLLLPVTISSSLN